MRKQRLTLQEVMSVVSVSGFQLLENETAAPMSLIEHFSWMLDVVFREDDSRVRTGHAAENLGLVGRSRFLSLLFLRPIDPVESINVVPPVVRF